MDAAKVGVTNSNGVTKSNKEIKLKKKTKMDFFFAILRCYNGKRIKSN